LDVLRDELKITSLDGFGSVADRRLVAEKLAGRVHLRGNVSCVVLKNGPEAAIRDECFDALRCLSPRGGFVLSDGYNVAPETPVAHVNLMMDCAEAFGLPPGPEETRRFPLT
jgi:uroporphyrinogen-III decarboxylase